MKRRTDFTGRRFFKLVAIRPTGELTKSRNAIWEMLCDCGNIRIANTGELNSGKAKSCGCFLKTQFTCEIEGCAAKATSRGLCHRHLHRFRATGDPTKTPSGTSFDLKERLAIKSNPVESGCIEWTGTLSSTGYGSTTYLGKTASTHRLSWLLHRGEIPEGMSVLHRCDNRKCINPDHLFLGTAKDNAEDAFLKGRRTRGRIGEVAKARWAQ